MKKVVWCGLVTLWMLICALMTSADLHRGYVWYDSANRKGFETKGKPLLCLWCFAASTVSDLVVTGSVLAVSISKTLLKEKNPWAFLTSFSRKSGSSLQTFSYLVSPFTIWALCPECWLVLFCPQSCVLGILRREMIPSEQHLCHRCVLKSKICSGSALGTVEKQNKKIIVSLDIFLL